ncbi:SatD family protein [Nesterenkonia pannonica]|uniref:SatD family protein n=1 Tax=Nesterenkonia pannonica TaxID=1548602 RepID=UPI0021642B12|nr:SatD family protein [Nesterenkonia pannonica]
MERTVGDEVQILLTHAEPALDLALHLMRRADWAVGVGAGPVETPLGPSARQSSGQAFFHAREAVERARGRGSRCRW